VQQER